MISYNSEFKRESTQQTTDTISNISKLSFKSSCTLHRYIPVHIYTVLLKKSNYPLHISICKLTYWPLLSKEALPQIHNQQGRSWCRRQILHPIASKAPAWQTLGQRGDVSIDWAKSLVQKNTVNWTQRICSDNKSDFIAMQMQKYRNF